MKILLVLLLVACNNNENSGAETNLENYKCTASQLINVKTEFDICAKSSYFSSHCFLSAKISQCKFIKGKK